MKLKHRGDVFTVIREGAGRPAAVLGVFSDAEEADNFKDAMAQEWFEVTKGTVAEFCVWITTYYG